MSEDQVTGENKVRIDKWLWAVRLYKTRSLAAAACSSGNVTIEGTRAKASRGLTGGEVILIRGNGLTRTFRVKALTDRRMGAARTPDYMEDLTPVSEYERRDEEVAANPYRRAKGEGRPTKRDRRILDLIRGTE